MTIRLLAGHVVAAEREHHQIELAVIELTRGLDEKNPESGQ